MGARDTVIRIILNGDAKEMPDSLTVSELLQNLGLQGGPVAVEINESVVKKADHANHRVNDGDRIEVVQFVGGG